MYHRDKALVFQMIDVLHRCSDKRRQMSLARFIEDYQHSQHIFCVPLIDAGAVFLREI